jgi:hypothetical protein
MELLLVEVIQDPILGYEHEQSSDAELDDRDDCPIVPEEVVKQ